MHSLFPCYLDYSSVQTWDPQFYSAYNILHRILRQAIPNVTRAATNFYHSGYLRTSHKYHYYSSEEIWSRKT